MIIIKKIEREQKEKEKDNMISRDMTKKDRLNQDDRKKNENGIEIETNYKFVKRELCIELLQHIE